MPLTGPRPSASELRSSVRENPYRLLAGAVAVAAGLAVFVLATDLFPYHSSNHDEGVYLQQAAMLLEGRLFLRPGSEALREAFHPWFFVEGERGLYPRYAPVPAALFTLGELAGGYRVALAAIAAVNVGAVYALTVAAFDRRTGVVAAAALALAPLFLLTSAVFLPYAPTTALNLVFAVAYVRAIRRSSWRSAVVAGAAIGLAFFARPFTAVLFAAPFVGHALWSLSRGSARSTALAPFVTAGVGLGFVGLTLGYNAAVTGSALLFPFEAFAPRDGLGFGQRALLGSGRLYSPSIALRSAVVLLSTLATDWFAAGPVGTGLAVVGGLLAARDARRRRVERSATLDPGQLQAVLAGVGVSVVVGNLLFWGNLNILGDVARPGDGFIGRFGPFYHFDLLVPLSAFAAHGAMSAVDGLRRRAAGSWGAVRLGAALLLVGSVAVAGAAEADALGPPIERNAAYTERFDRAYAPFEAAGPANALVFLPPTSGEWLNHPYQWLRNDPGFDGRRVYAVSRTPAGDFAVLDAYPNRSYYRYRYHGRWEPDPTAELYPVLEPVRRVEAPAVTARTTVAVPDRIVALSVAVTDGDTVRRYDYRGPIPARVTVDWTVGPDGVVVDHPALVDGGGTGPVTLDGPEAVVLTVTVTEPSGASLTYRESLQVRPTGSGVEALWPPATSVCLLVTDCGVGAAYVPDRPGTRPAGIERRTVLVPPPRGDGGED